MYRGTMDMRESLGDGGSYLISIHMIHARRCLLQSSLFYRHRLVPCTWLQLPLSTFGVDSSGTGGIKEE